MSITSSKAQIQSKKGIQNGNSNSLVFDEFYLESTQLENHELKVKELNKKIASLLAKNNSLISMQKEVEKEIEVMKNKFLAQKCKNQLVNEKTEDNENKESHFQNEKINPKLRINSDKNVISKINANSENESKNTTVFEYNKRIEALHCTIKNNSDQMNFLSKENSSLKIEINERNEEKKSILLKIKSLEDEIEKSNLVIMQINEQIIEYEKAFLNFNKLQNDYNQMIQSNQDLSIENQKLKLIEVNNNQLSKENNSLKEEIFRLTNIELKFSELSNENILLKNQMEEYKKFEEKYLFLNEKIENYQIEIRELTSIKKKYELLQNEFALSQSKLNSYMKIEESLISCQQAYKILEKEKEELNSNLEKYEKVNEENLQMKKQFQESYIEYENLKNEKIVVEEELTEIKLKLTNYPNIVKENETLISENENLKKQNQKISKIQAEESLNFLTLLKKLKQNYEIFNSKISNFFITNENGNNIAFLTELSISKAVV